MKLQMHSVHFKADQKLLDFIQTKANKLDTFHDRITSGEVYLRLSTEKETQNNNKIVEIKLFIPGDSLFVKEEQTTFEAAADLCIDALKEQLRRIKDRQKNHPPVDKEALVPVEEDLADDLDL